MRVEKEFDELKREIRYLGEITQYILNRCPIKKGSLESIITSASVGYQTTPYNQSIKLKTKEDVFEENKRVQSGEQLYQCCAYCGVVIEYAPEVIEKNRLCQNCKRNGRLPYKKNEQYSFDVYELQSVVARPEKP